MYQRWYYAGSIVHFSDYAVGVFAYQKMIYIFSHHACVLPLSLQTFNLNNIIVIH